MTLRVSPYHPSDDSMINKHRYYSLKLVIILFNEKVSKIYRTPYS